MNCANMSKGLFCFEPDPMRVTMLPSLSMIWKQPVGLKKSAGIPCLMHGIPCFMYGMPCRMHGIPCLADGIPALLTVNRVSCMVYRVLQTVYRAE